MKTIFSPHDQEIIDLLRKLGRLEVEYPQELLVSRRAAFTAEIERRKAIRVGKEKSLSQERIIEILKRLKPASAGYPPELFAARRASFIAQIEQHNGAEVEAELPLPDQTIELLENLKTVADDYPPELLAARRAAFIAQIKQYNKTEVQEEVLPLQNGRLSKLLAHLKSIEIEYPLKLWTARRSTFVSQIRNSGISVLDALRIAIQGLLKKGQTPVAPAMSFRRTAMIIATVLAAFFMGSLFYRSGPPLSELPGPSFSQREGSHPGSIASTSTDEVAEVICKPGYAPPLCLAQEFDKSSDLTFAGNGTARPAVAKDTIPGYGRIHQPAYVNDGLYGSGASWVSNSAYSWIKIDLGEARTINTITFGRDRLGNFNDGDPGQFVVAVALSDNIYADGNSSNDYMEYTEVYNSREAGFDGVVSGAETVEANFEPVTARFVKITFENARTAVDEVEVFMIQPLGFVGNPTQKPREDQPRATLTAIPTDTLVPTIPPTALPTKTPVPPTFTSTPRPTNTPVPTVTNTPRPPNTPTDVPTNTPEPTDTQVPPPTDTQPPRPTDTAEPPPTNSPQPTDTQAPPPINTPQPTEPVGAQSFPTETPMEVVEH